MDVKSLAMFCLVFGGALVLPGPNAAFSVAQSIHYGFFKALPVAFGFAIGTLANSAAVLFGLGLVVAQHPALFDLFKWIGIIYLFYLSIQIYIAGIGDLNGRPKSTSSLNLLVGALVVSLTNPKGLLWAALIFPPFISPASPYEIQAMMLVSAAVFLSFSVYTGYILVAHSIRGRLLAWPYTHKVICAVYALVGIALALR
jgi:homoserine/homoserine lactone efflux protein